jgi:hypothetical protein
MWQGNPKNAAIHIYASDRREAIRAALGSMEMESRIWHWGAGDACTGDRYHYDGAYRKCMSVLSEMSGGVRMGCSFIHWPCDVFVGPPHIIGLDKLELKRPVSWRYSLVCMNPDPWGRDNYDLNKIPWGRTRFYAMSPGAQDGDCSVLYRELVKRGGAILKQMQRIRFRLREFVLPAIRGYVLSSRRANSPAWIT